MRYGILPLALLAATATANESGWRNLDGQKAPQITAKEWLNAGKNGPEPADLRGKVILLEFFATW